MPGFGVGELILKPQHVDLYCLLDTPSQVSPGCTIGLNISRSKGSDSGLEWETDLLIHPWLLIRVCIDLFLGGSTADRMIRLSQVGEV